jgi:hypothetical protein
MSFEVLSTFNVGTGTSTGFSIGLVTWSPQSSGWRIVTPNGSGSGTPNHFLQVTTLSGLVAGARWTWNSDPAGIPWGSTSSAAPTVPAAAWLGNIPLVTNAITPVPVQAFLAACATGTVVTTGSAGGLAKFRLKYYTYGNIIQ